MPKPLLPKVKTNSAAFDRHQLALLRYIANEVKEGLSAAGVEPAKLYEATGNTTFRIAAIIDSSAVMELGGKPLRPFLTFAQDDDAKQLLAAGGSWMHEYVFGLVDELFPEDERRSSPQASADEPLTITADAEGWTRCPKCNFRFSVHSGSSFEKGIHTRCGQRLNVVFEEAGNT